MYDQPPGDIDLVMDIKMELHINHDIQSHGPHTTSVCHDQSIILNISKKDQLYCDNNEEWTVKYELNFLT